MSLQVIRQQSVHFDQTGKIGSVDETYVKISVSFARLLQTFKGARLSAFLCLSLNEAEISFGRSIGLSIYDIAEKSGYDERTILRSMQYLNKFNYADAIAERGAHGETLYRVRGYAWFGNPKSAPTPASKRCDKMSHRRKNVTPGMTKSPSVVVGTDIQELDILETTTNRTRAREIFAQAGVCEPALSLLGMSVAEENAQAWADWLADAPASFTEPVAYAVKCLRADAEAVPPMAAKAKPRKAWCAEYEHLVNR